MESLNLRPKSRVLSRSKVTEFSKLAICKGPFASKVGDTEDGGGEVGVRDRSSEAQFSRLARTQGVPADHHSRE